MPSSRTLVLDNRQISQRIDRIAFQIYEQHYQEKEIVMAGIADNGYVLAERLAQKIMEISPLKVKLASVSVYKKDPLSKKVTVSMSDKELEGQVVIVVDDVLESGRTLMHGIQPFMRMKVKRMNTVVLVDRAHHSFPVRADFVGVSLATTMQEHIEVTLNGGKKDAVYLV